MIRLKRFLIFCFLILCLIAHHGLELVNGQDSSNNPWKITSVKICKSSAGAVYPTIEAIGSYPVYTFFIPRPVWTVNGVVVDATPVYQTGRLVSFQLMNAGSSLKNGAKNTVKFALPDHNGSRVFFFEPAKFGPGECYEFF